ncbi:hypothetical protein BDM02DRAFT_3270901 [Thelephora ganbajun]|uniref:Uncharacterized protein n=1 Tax=Thelephora ganbajun TaxID=370292 RepID=A0ACB6ZB77_THEGA|nr:hypothetical protein BDM02DRAFT_3270901 [Thelephora ganbajun]
MATHESNPAKEDATQQVGPDIGVREHHAASRPFRTADLQQARSILAEEVSHLICLPLEYLWESYPLDNADLPKVKQHLVQKNLLSNKGKWHPTIHKERFAKKSDGIREAELFSIFSRTFNAVLSSLADHEKPTSGCVERMVHAVSVEPQSARHQPDAFLLVDTGTSPKPTGHRFRWRDLTCPFEYKFGNGDAVDNDTKVLRSLHHIVRSDPCRIFSFGVAIYGTKFRIWLLCRAAPFVFAPFDWFEDPESAIKFFAILATSSATDLGFDTNIKRIGDCDFDLQFNIQGTEYNTSMLLYNVGADIPCGRGTWVFEVVDQETKEVRAIKDCWVENRRGKHMEHEIVATDTSGGFQGVCDILSKEEFKSLDNFYPQLLVLARTNSKPIYSRFVGNSTPNRSHHSRRSPPPTQLAPTIPPHPRFRYQVVYSNRGISLFEVTSLEKVFVYLDQTVIALLHLHKAGWVHRDLSPGNIIVVDGKVKISDLEFAKRRVAQDLERLTRRTDQPLPVVKDTRTGTLPFMAIEVQVGRYQFRQMSTTKPSGFLTRHRGPDGEVTSVICPNRQNATRPDMEHTERIFLHNPLHDYESVWWIVVWFVFHYRPAGVANDIASQTRAEVYKNRFTAFTGEGVFKEICEGLPQVLQPLGEILAWMRHLLVEAYQTFEENFDGSKMLSVVGEFRDCLLNLRVRAQGLDVEVQEAPLVLPNRPDVDEFDVVELPETDRDKLEVMEGEEEGGEACYEAGNHLLQVDDPFVEVPAEGAGDGRVPVAGKAGG